MSEKRFTIEEIGNMFRVLKDDEPLTTKFESRDKQDVKNLVEELNEQDKAIEFKKKHILCLQSAIQTIDVEIQEKGMSKKRFDEIKGYWYLKFKGDLE